MGTRRAALGGVAVAGSVAAAVMAARRLASDRRADNIYGPSYEPMPPRQWGAGYGGAPVFFHHSRSFEAYFSASSSAVAAMLPSSDLHPVRLPGGRGVVFVAGLQHGELTGNGVDGLCALPYGEVMIGALVTRRPAPPLLPLVAPPATGFAAGAFVLHLPVTTRVSRDVGRQVWGYPKFVADMDFDDSVAERRVRLTEGGRHILTLTVRPAGRPSIADGSLLLYSVLDGRLIELDVPGHGIEQRRWGRKGGRLELGDHQVADDLRHLSLGADPFLTVVITGQRLVMPVGRPVGSARAYLGYIGEDRDLGRYVVRYPGTAAIDRYAPYAATAGPRSAMGGPEPSHRPPPSVEAAHVSG
jgi:hypothetical protein